MVFMEAQYNMNNTMTIPQCLSALAIGGRPDCLTPEARTQVARNIDAIYNRLQTLMMTPGQRKPTRAQLNYVAAVMTEWKGVAR